MYQLTRKFKTKPFSLFTDYNSKAGILASRQYFIPKKTNDVQHLKKKKKGVFLCQSIDLGLQGKKEIANNKWKGKLEKIK